MSCDRPITLEALAGWWLGELAPAEAEELEAHLFGCDGCAGETGQNASLLLALRDTIPPVVDRRFVDRLQARGLRLRITEVPPGERVDVVFSPDVDILVHRLLADLAGAERVDCHIVDSAGHEVAAYEDVPFDADVGLHIACQRHFALVSPDPDTRFRVYAWEQGQRRTVGEFRVMHNLWT